MLYNLLYDSNTKLNIPYNSNKKPISIKTKLAHTKSVLLHN